MSASAGVLVPFVQRDWTLWLLAAGAVVFGRSAVVYNITQVSFRQGLCPSSCSAG